MAFASDYTMTIDGSGVAAAAELTVLNPATGEPVASALDCSASELDDAVAAARRRDPDGAALGALVTRMPGRR